jgi:hypothetical protein
MARRDLPSVRWPGEFHPGTVRHDRGASVCRVLHQFHRNDRIATVFLPDILQILKGSHHWLSTAKRLTKHHAHFNVGLND